MHRYRADIDGLRAVAIVPVVLFHAGLDSFRGGFVGVDVFFVISGFLITGLILPEIERGAFSIAGFYERRIRRILPALFAVLIFASAVATWILLPGDLVAFGRSALATALFTSNFVFWQESGYFASAAEEMPLLHTWSLAVEEQFYILFPLGLLLVARRLGRRYLLATVTVVVVSFASSVIVLGVDRDAAFYLAPTRAWELGLGALLAMGAFRPSHHSQVRHLVAVLGAAAIAWSVARFSAATPFPGVAALLPCAGTAAIIWAGSGGHNVIGDLLSRRPFVLTGLVSYSLYLWHWPLLAFARYYRLGALGVLDTLVVLTVATAAAILSWRYVERPFRGKSGLMNRRQLFAVTAAAMVAATGFGLATMASGGFPVRVDDAVRGLVAAAHDRRPLDWRCAEVTPDDVKAGRLCRVGSEAAAPSFVVWGDSHARVMADAIGEAAARHGRSGLLAIRSACAPLPGVRRTDHGARRQCPEFNRAVISAVEARPEIVDVILVGRWALLAEGVRYAHEYGSTVLLADADTGVPSLPENRRVFERSLESTVERLRRAGKRVWIVASVPEVGWDVPSTLARAHRFGRDLQIAPTRRQFLARQAFVFATLEDLTVAAGITVLRPDTVLCPQTTCAIVVDGRPLYFDGHHLTLHGARLLEPLFESVFSGTSPPDQASGGRTALRRARLRNDATASSTPLAMPSAAIRPVMLSWRA